MYAYYFCLGLYVGYILEQKEISHTRHSKQMCDRQEEAVSELWQCGSLECWPAIMRCHVKRVSLN